MTVTKTELTDRLAEIEDPMNDDDIVSLGLVNDVTIHDETTALISLAFNAPHAPTERAIGENIRDTVEELGLDVDLTAAVDEEHGFVTDVLPGVRNVIAVASGKGGVGKTTVAANLAAGLAEKGARVGLLDADVHGPNAPTLLPTGDEPGVAPNGDILPPESDDVMVMSTEYLMPETGDEPAALRGPMVNNVMMKFINEVQWGYRDYLIVDLPPGTGDASLNLVQTLPVAGVVIITTPQEMAVDDARKGLRLFEQHDVPVLGVVENMSGFRCPECDEEHPVFGRSEPDDSFDAPILARLPAHPDFTSEESEGPVVRDEESPLWPELMQLAETVADNVGQANRRRVAEHVKE
ncbi:P-loop NTPase [Halopenitus sp. H-Gu1]|uniref:Mrp/NBP35 family ATP-binding protein n=1 Tax=Halopenitus sp. H-Gu1 TaxID=3242697 RepID=UPI00359D8C3C